MKHYLAEIKISLAFTPMLVRPLAKYAASDAFQNFLLSLVHGVVAVKRFKFWNTPNHKSRKIWETAQSLHIDSQTKTSNFTTTEAVRKFHVKEQ